MILALGVLGCHKTDLTKAKLVYARWELGWSMSKECILGAVGHSADADTQAALADALNERGQCPRWFLGDNHDLDAGSALDNDKKRAETLSASENAVNIFTELQPGDLTDDLADAMLKLTEAVDNARANWPKGVGKLIAARTRVRTLLGLPPDDTWPVSQPLTITDLKIRPGITAPPPVASKWSIDVTGHPRVVDAAGKPVFDLATDWGDFAIIPDAADPVVWQTRREGDDLSDLRVAVYQPDGAKWKRRELDHVVYLNSNGHRLDLLMRPKRATSSDDPVTAPSWVWFAPGQRQEKPIVLGTVQRMAWACSSDRALWVHSAQTGDSQDEGADPDDAVLLIRAAVDATDSQPPFVLTSRAPSGEGPTCDDQAVAYESFRVVCPIPGHDCLEVQPDVDTDGAALVDGQLLVPRIHHGMLVILVPDGPPSVFRLPAVPQGLRSELLVRDHQPFLELPDGREIGIPWPPRKT